MKADTVSLIISCLITDIWQCLLIVSNLGRIDKNGNSVALSLSRLAEGCLEGIDDVPDKVKACND